jgi:predicted transcriptional regulator
MNTITYGNLSIGEDLRKMRHKAGLSQASVARKARIRPEVLCRIETGQGNPTVGTVSKIVKAIEILSK